MFKKSGEHPLVIEYNELIDRCEEIDRELTELNRASRDALPQPKYDWTIKRTKRGTDHFDRGPEEEGFIAYGVLKEESSDQVKEHMRLYGSITDPPEDTKSSVFYFRKNGLILSSGGGTLLFPRHTECTDEQWAQLMNGEMVEELLSDYYRGGS